MEVSLQKRDFEFFAVSEKDRWEFFATITKFEPQELEFYREAIRRSGRNDLRIAVSERCEGRDFWMYSLVTNSWFGNDFSDFFNQLHEVEGERALSHYLPEYKEFNFDEETLPVYKAAVERYGSDKLSIYEGGFDCLGNYHPTFYALVCTDTKAVNFSKFWSMHREAKSETA